MAPTASAQQPDLIVAQDGKSTASIVVAPDAGEWEKRAATDLQLTIEKMSGARLPLVPTIAPNSAALVVGQAALKAEPTLRQALDKVAKKNPVLRADAIVVRRRGNRVFIAGTNDESHYYAASWLLQRWGCRWYLPTDFGECIPDVPTLKLGALDFAYAPPFEVRHYWLSWYGADEGAEEFRKRNFMSSAKPAGMGHALATYTADLALAGKTAFEVPFAEESTAQHVAKKIEAEYAKGVDGISLGIEDGTYNTDSPRDNELKAGIYDKYFQKPALSDAMMAFYNNVASILRQKHPQSKTLIGGMAYANVTLPPQRAFVPEPSLVMWLAPIDFDANHAMNDARSPSRMEYGAVMRRWAQLMQGRLVIYDYDQAMLVWRDLPNPSQQVFAQDAKIYRDAKILGIGTESRGAAATTFLNLFFRGQLMWNPDADTQSMLAEFYPKFYGPASAPMSAYWNAIFAAWQSTIVTEHETFAASSIYTPELVAQLKTHLEAAEALMKAAPANRDAAKYLERMKFTRLSFEIISNYVAMTQSAAAEADYKAAVASGERALAARGELGKMNPTFTTTKLESGAAWWPGEVQQYRDLSAITDGTKGTLITKTPLEWPFRRDPHDSGLAMGWAYEPIDLSYWKAHSAGITVENRKDYPAQWEMLRSDKYLQAQGVRFPDNQSFTGHAWYRTSLDLKAEQVKGAHIRFPGLFNECWLYVNGNLVAHREQGAVWWLNDYKFEWDVDLSSQLKAGANSIALRIHNPHHFGGIFRRPFLYRPLP